MALDKGPIRGGGALCVEVLKGVGVGLFEAFERITVGPYGNGTLSGKGEGFEVA